MAPLFRTLRSPSVAVRRQVHPAAQRHDSRRTSLNRSHSPDTHKWCPLVGTVAPLRVPDILVKSVSYNEQPQTCYKVAHRNDGPFKFIYIYIYIYIYIFNTTRPAHCDYNHPHTSTNAHNLYEITNHPHTRSLPHVSTINRHPL